MVYGIDILPAAVRQLASLPQQLRARLRERIDRLAANPRPSGIRALQGNRPSLRLRVGDYRVIYRVDDSAKMVHIVRIGHRREVYREDFK